MRNPRQTKPGSVRSNSKRLTKMTTSSQKEQAEATGQESLVVATPSMATSCMSTRAARMPTGAPTTGKGMPTTR